MRYEVDHRGDNVTVYAHPSAIFSFHRSRLKGSFPLWSVFSYLELWAFLSGSAICLTDLTLMSDGLSTSPKGAYSSVSCNNPLRSLTFPNRHWSQSKVVVSSHTSICENRLRFCCLTVGCLLIREKEANRSIRAQKVTGWKHCSLSLKFEQPSEVTNIVCPFCPETFPVHFTLNRLI